VAAMEAVAAAASSPSAAADISGVSYVALKKDGKISILTRSVFHFCPFISVFAGSRFRIYGNRRGVFLSVSAGSRFHPKLTRIYSVFHPVLNLYEMCRN
jgi:hypothetical protein